MRAHPGEAAGGVLLLSLPASDDVFGPVLGIDGGLAIREQSRWLSSNTIAAIRWTMTGIYKGEPLIVYRKTCPGKGLGEHRHPPLGQ